MRYYDANGLYQAGKAAGCKNLVAVGGKGNGKTFGFLRKGIDIFLGLEDPALEGYIIRYARRLKESVVSTNLKNLFRPHLAYIEQVTNGEYNMVVQRGRRFYLAYYEDDKKVRQMQREFCVVNSLSTWETDSGADEGEAGICIYDECISRERELIDEFSSIMRWHNNCMRNRTGYYCPLVLLGNTVTRDCTILEDFGIDLWSLDADDQGKVIYVRNRAGELNVIFEWCGKVDVQAESAREYYDRFYNDKTRMITDGVFSLGTYKTMHPDRCERCSDDALSIYLVTPHAKLRASVRIKKQGGAFMYITPIEHLKDGDVIINPRAVTCTGNVVNFMPKRLRDLFTTFFALGNMIFDRPQTGEIYRSFAGSCPGLESCIPD